MTTKKCSAKKVCSESPDGEHCWHVSNPSIVLIPGGSSKINEFCCWCGETRSYDFEPTFSQSYNTMEHGPHYKETYICQSK